MPIHDWTRVNAGTWHAFHLSLDPEIQQALNGGLLPPSYYAQAEQIAGPMGPDVLTFQVPEMTPEFDTPEAPGGGGLAVATAPRGLARRRGRDERLRPEAEDAGHPARQRRSVRGPDRARVAGQQGRPVRLAIVRREGRGGSLPGLPSPDRRSLPAGPA